MGVTWTDDWNILYHENGMGCRVSIRTTSVRLGDGHVRKIETNKEPFARPIPDTQLDLWWMTQ